MSRRRNRESQSQKILTVGIAVLFFGYLGIWKLLTHNTANDPVFQLKHLFSRDHSEAVKIPPPRSLLSWKDTLPREEKVIFQQALDALSGGKDPHQAGKLLWPFAATTKQMRPSVSYQFTNLAAQARAKGDMPRALMLAQMAAAFNARDFRAHQTAWAAAAAMNRSDLATEHYQLFLSTKPNLKRRKPPSRGALGFLLLLLIGAAVGGHHAWDKLGWREKFEAMLMAQPEPAMPAARSNETIPPPAPPSDVPEGVQPKLSAEKKKSITAILSAEAFLQDVQKAFDNKDYEKGVDLCVKAVEINETNTTKVSNICLAEGIRLFEVGDYAHAQELLEVSLHFEPHVLEANTSLGNCYIKLGDFAKAREQYEKVIEVDPKNGDAYYTLGVCYQKTNDLPRAKRSFQVAVQLKDHPNSHFYLAKLHEGEKDYASAITHWNRFVELAPNSPQAAAARDRVQKLASLAGGASPAAG